jgi:hypothetical protein
LHPKEELLACVVARLIGEARHVTVGAASPIPATACLLLRVRGYPLRVSLLHKRSGNPFTEGSRELFDLAGQRRIDVFFLGGAQIDGEANINLVRAEGRIQPLRQVLPRRDRPARVPERRRRRRRAGPVGPGITAALLLLLGVWPNYAMDLARGSGADLRAVQTTSTTVQPENRE